MGNPHGYILPLSKRYLRCYYLICLSLNQIIGETLHANISNAYYVGNIFKYIVYLIVMYSYFVWAIHTVTSYLFQSDTPDHIF